MAREPIPDGEAGETPGSDRLTPTKVVRWGLVLVVAGCVLAWIGTSTVADAAGITIAGIGGVALISAAFLAVGLAEDRERERSGR